MRDIAYSVRRLVGRHQGSLPVLITCPHGGDERPDDVDERTGAGLPPECRFEKTTDRFTRTIARGVAQALFDVFSQTPYVVFANFDRAYIDANRSPACAFEDARARPFYDEYHGAIRRFVTEIRRDNGGLGLLFDIHGTDGVQADPAELYLGTLDGSSVEKLLLLDPAALSRKRSLRGLLTREGYDLSKRSPETLRGGFTLEAYGSANPDGLDAIQLEIGTPLRTNGARRAEFIEDAAFAMSHLIARYADTGPMAAFRSANFLLRLPR